ncbi:uncharacterized protein A4U43_C03F24900 [Asparagus officinalis]|uniref:Uncharacterized protein n=1 Tax=Asparagus officinalis TaxID=4686 RepID=A0A5P1FHR9_ASPOF|nr:uncharacterized protein A4U43_C03F24900 [Asparagus officinalis]
MPGEDFEAPGKHPAPHRHVDIIIQELTAPVIRQETPGRGQGKGKRLLHPPPPQPSKKQRLASPELEPMPRGSSRIRKESLAVPVTVGEAMPTSFLMSGHFDPVIDFEGTFGVLASAPTIEMIEAPMPACLEVAQHQKEELELNLAELTKKWDSQIAELLAETKRFSVIRSQAAPIDLRILKEKAQKGALEVGDSRMAECIA